ncbi:hypothetical protein [Actinoplanes sp. TFC3]|uniref:8-oxoguanine DNA glycosylase OGG fold protein n=1 Tax=Actinoplanes sp. TFC3 TaxID=1710355 RepID=UPI00129078F0|nr:hypothetical protein [Actinoplanes sp. TFC3]
MLTTMPPQLSAHLASDVQQRGFSWRRKAWETALHDDQPSLDLLHRLGDKMDRESTRVVVLEELSSGRVVPAFAAAMVWGYGTVSYGPERVRWVLTGVRGKASASAAIEPEVREKLATGAAVARQQGPVEGFRRMNNDGKVAYLGGAFFTKWLYFTTAIAGIADPNAAPILDAQVATWLRANGVATLNVNKTPGYQQYLGILRDWGQQVDRAPAQVEAGIFHLATGR